jgi:hypothetical protein
MRRYVLLLAIAALTSTGGVAHAEDVGSGLSCGLTSTGTVFQFQSGVVTGGPWTMRNTALGSISQVTVTCRIQINNAAFGGTGPVVNGSAFGPVAAAEGTVAFQVPFDANVYLCTTISWDSAKGGGAVNLDFDPGTVGDQCARAGTTGSGTFFVVPTARSFGPIV